MRYTNRRLTFLRLFYSLLLLYYGQINDDDDDDDDDDVDANQKLSEHNRPIKPHNFGHSRACNYRVPNAAAFYLVQETCTREILAQQ